MTPSPAWIVTLYGEPEAAPAAMLPPITPVAAPIERPAGSPVALYCRVPGPASLAKICNATPSPASLVWLPGLVNVTPTDQLNVSTALLVPSLTVTVVVNDPVLAVMVPEIKPVLELMLRPVGKPLAAKLSVPLAVSVADTCRETLSPGLLTWSPGSVMVMGLLTVQLKLCALL